MADEVNYSQNWIDAATEKGMSAVLDAVDSDELSAGVTREERYANLFEFAASLATAAAKRSREGDWKRAELYSRCALHIIEGVRARR